MVISSVAYYKGLEAAILKQKAETAALDKYEAGQIVDADKHIGGGLSVPACPDHTYNLIPKIKGENKR